MFIASTPLGRRGRPEDIAKTAVFLASDDAAWITGEQIVSGGMYVLNGTKAHDIQ
ncbi:NAD(P)-dependent dehydrogenase (short-subunit alcohol dehydrogenase family) [Chryseobacterium sp. H1D6B]|nr:NAD(P)-dependent dehydrogenase (short-subunit alcohol dehydrogenase family) [Chryseobacterium sp. H1D6B]